MTDNYWEKRGGRLPAMGREERLSRSRARAAIKREQIQSLMQKDSSDRTPSEKAILNKAMEQRHKKNERARKRAGEHCQALGVILAKPEEQRTVLERSFVEQQLKRKLRKVQGDKLRRLRDKHGDKPNLQQEPLPNSSNLQRINYSVVAKQVLRNRQFEDAHSDLEADAKPPAIEDKAKYLKQEEAPSLKGRPVQGHPYRTKPRPLYPSYGVPLYRRPHDVTPCEGLSLSAHAAAASMRNHEYYGTRPVSSLYLPSLSPWISGGARPTIGTEPGALFDRETPYERPPSLSRHVPPPPPHIYTMQPPPPLPPVPPHSHYGVGYGEIAVPLPRYHREYYRHRHHEHHHHYRGGGNQHDRQQQQQQQQATTANHDRPDKMHSSMQDAERSRIGNGALAKVRSSTHHHRDP